MEGAGAGYWGTESRGRNCGEAERKTLLGRAAFFRRAVHCGAALRVDRTGGGDSFSGGSLGILHLPSLCALFG